LAVDSERTSSLDGTLNEWFGSFPEVVLPMVRIAHAIETELPLLSTVTETTTIFVRLGYLQKILCQVVIGVCGGFLEGAIIHARIGEQTLLLDIGMLGLLGVRSGWRIRLLHRLCFSGESSTDSNEDSNDTAKLNDLVV
jgi:hypothetical protein